MDEKRKIKILGLFDYAMYIIGLNLLFLLCSIPVLTMGASLTALYAGLRAMVKQEPCFRAFFSTFRKSFGRATLFWVVLLPVNVLMCFNAMSIGIFRVSGFLIPLILSTLLALIFLSVSTMIFLFYSRFEGTVLQLLQYGGTLFFSHPLRGLIIAVLTWLPVFLFFLFPSVFLFLIVVWLFLYFAAVSTVAIWLMNSPFIRFARDTLGMDVTRVVSRESEEE